MKGIHEVLEKLEIADMHVHVIDHSEGYKNIDAPIAHLVMSTHFVMQENKIVHVGTVNSIKRFALNLEE